MVDQNWVPLSTFNPDVSIFTDTSTEGWGSYLEGQETSGTWNNQEKTLHINIVELRAVRLATTHFSVHLAVKQQLLTTDNMTPGCLNVPADKLSQIHKTTNRMVTTPSCTREPLATMEETHDRPFCNKRKQTIIICEKKMKKKKKIIICEPSSGRICFHKRCSDDMVEQPLCICLSPRRTDKQSDRQTKII